GHLILVGDDVAVGIHLDAGLLEPDVLDDWSAANGPHHAIHGSLSLSVPRDHLQTSVDRALQGLGPGAGDDLDSDFAQQPHRRLADHGIEALQDRRPAHDQGGPGAQLREDPGKLDGDVATAHYGDAPRLLLQLEEAVRGYAEIHSGDVREHRTAPGGNDDVLAEQRALADDDGMPVPESRPAAHQLDAVLRQRGLVDCVELGDVSVALALQKGPVEAVRLEMKAVLGSVVRGVGKVGGIPHDLFRNTADIDAGAPQPARLDEGHARAILACAPRARQAATATTDNDQIEFAGHTAITPKAPGRPSCYMAPQPGGAGDRRSAERHGVCGQVQWKHLPRTGTPWKTRCWARNPCHRSRTSVPSTSSRACASC